MLCCKCPQGGANLRAEKLQVMNMNDNFPRHFWLHFDNRLKRTKEGFPINNIYI